MNTKKKGAEILEEILAHINISITKLTEELGLSTRTPFYRIKSGGNFSKNLAKKITDRYKEINYEYLTKGIGTLVDDEPDMVFINTNGNVFTEKKDGSFDVRVKYLPFSKYDFYLESLKNNTLQYQWDDVTFCVDQFGKGNYLGFKTNSNSMNGGMLYDTPSGASLLGRELGRHHWEDGFRSCDSGWIILTEKNIFHKDITHFNKEKKTITCSSRNDSPEYVDFELQLDDILQIFKVIKRTF